jgi:hypothetical protein
MTIYDELRRPHKHKDLILGLTIEGIRFAFTERTISATALSLMGRPQQLVVLNRVTEGETKLDLEKRREVAATLDVELVDLNTLQLQELFASASRRNTYIESNAEPSDTEVAAGDTTAIIAAVSANGYCDIYVGSETITVVGIGTVSSTISNEPVMFGDILGWGAIPVMPISVGDALQIVRGAYDSVPIELRGNIIDEDGDSIFLVPPSWKGRRAKLWGIIGDKVDVLNSFVLDGSPEISEERTWRIRCAGISQRYFEKRVSWGLSESVISYRGFRDEGGGLISTEYAVYSNLQALRNTASNRPNYVILSGTDLAGEEIKIISRVIDVDDVFGRLFVVQVPQFGTRLISQTLFNKAQPILISAGANPSNILSVIVSKEGQSVVPPPFGYDIHAGRRPQNFDDTGWSLGAGIPLTDVDADAWRGSSINYTNQVFMSAKEMKLEEVLLEWCLVNNTAIVCDNIGRLKPVNLNVYRQTERRELTKDDINPDTVVYVVNDEENIAPVGKVMLDYSPLDDDYKVEVNLIDADLSKRYPESNNQKTFEIKSMGVSSGGFIRVQRDFQFAHPVSVGIGEIVSRFAKLLKAGFGDTFRTMSIDVTLEQLDLRVGDLVVLTDLPPSLAELPDFQGATISGLTCRIIGKRPDYDNNILKLNLHILNRSLYVAPSAVITGIAGNVLTLSTTTPEARNSSPANDFAVNAGVTVKSHNSDTVLNTTVTTVNSGTQLTLASVSGLAIGNIVSLNPFTSDFAETVSGYSLSEIAGWVDEDGRATATSNLAIVDPLWS